MKMSTLFFLLFPILIYCQPSITIDSVGNSARIGLSSPLNSIIIGQNAGNPLATGSNNLLIGNNNGSSLTSGFRNIFLGGSNGQNNTNGSYNINIGVGSGSANQTGSFNINIGDISGNKDLAGNSNVRIGDGAGSNGSGSRNIMLGSFAGANYTGDDKLFIHNSDSATPLIYGDFSIPLIRINGDFEVTGNILIDVSQITGKLGDGNSEILPVVFDNTVEIEIIGIVTSNFVLTNTIGFEIDTFTLPGLCLEPNTGLNMEFPLTIETTNPTDSTAMANWFASPDARPLSIIIKDVAGIETGRFNMYEYYPGTSGPGSDGRHSFTLNHDSAPNNTTQFEYTPDFGTAFSYNPVTDKLVEILNITVSNFCPAVQVDYAKRVITLEMTYNEGEGLLPWIDGFGNGILDKRSMSIIETTDGMTEITRENFFEVVPFKYEIIYGVGLNTKLKARIMLLYGCNAPG